MKTIITVALLVLSLNALAVQHPRDYSMNIFPDATTNSTGDVTYNRDGTQTTQMGDAYYTTPSMSGGW